MTEPDQATPYRRLSREETRRSLESLNLNIWLRSVCDTICAGATFVFVSFALALDVPKEKIGYFSSVLGFACVLQVVGIAASRYARSKKRFVMTLSMLEPVVLISIVLVAPLLPVGWRFWALIVAMFAAAGLLHLTKPLTEEWTASTIPAGLRGRYLGRRLQVLTVLTIGTVLLTGWLASRLNPENPFGFGVLLAIGGAFGWLAVLPLQRVSLPQLSAEATIRLREVWVVWRHQPFRRFVIGMLLFLFPFTLAMPYYQVYHLQELKLTTMQIAFMQTGYLVCKVLVSRLVGRWSDRLGPRRLMLLASPIYVLFFATYGLTRPGLAWPIYVAWIVCGIADSVYFVAYTSSLYTIVPRDRVRLGYFAAINLAMLGLHAVGALIAVEMVTALADVSLTLGGWHLGQFQIHYLICSVLMFIGLAGCLAFPRTARLPQPPTTT